MGIETDRDRRDAERAKAAVELLRPISGLTVNNAVICEASLVLMSQLVNERLSASTIDEFLKDTRGHEVVVDLVRRGGDAELLLHVVLSAIGALIGFWDIATIRREIADHRSDCECRKCVESFSLCDCGGCRERMKRYANKTAKARRLVESL